MLRGSNFTLISKVGRWQPLTLKLFSLLSLLFLGLPAAFANGASQLRTTDYFINHISKEPFYTENDLDPNVILHVREVVLAGRERSAAKDNKVLLLIHGGTFPGYIAFDLDYENVSMMRHFAKLGWDTFTVDLERFRSIHPTAYNGQPKGISR